MLKTSDNIDSINIDQEGILVDKYNNSQLIKEKSENQRKKNNQDSLQELIFDEVLHKLIINSLGKDYTEDLSAEKGYATCKYKENDSKDLLSEDNVNKILPAIRTQYIREWKKIIVGEEGFNGEKAKAMEDLVSKFDNILQKQQDRNQKKYTFTILFYFFAIETILLFIILFGKGLDYFSGLNDGILQIIIGSTIGQVSIMLTGIIYYLYPSENKIKQNEGNIS